MRILLIFYFIIIKFNLLYSQYFFFKNIGTDQGLPSSETYHPFQDSKGFIWITTDAGICKYDGKTFKTYTIKDGLPENVVFNIYEDIHGRIWFNCLSGYLFYYENNKFVTIAANQELKQLLFESNAMFFYIGIKDTLYCSTAYVKGIIKIPPQNNYKNIIIQKVGNCNTFIKENNLKKNEILMGAGNLPITFKMQSYSCYNFTNNKLYLLQFTPSYNQINAKVDILNNIYLPGNKTLTIIRSKNGRIEHYDFDSDILSLNQDKEGDLWVGTMKGGFFYKKSDLNSKPVCFLRDLSVANILVDRENNIWVCSLQKGLFISLNKTILDVYTENDQICNFLKSNKNFCIGFASKKEIQVDKNNYVSSSFINENLNTQYGILKYFFRNNQYSYYGTNVGLFYIKNRKKIIVENYIGSTNPNIFTRKIISIAKDSFIAVNTLELNFIYKEKCFDRIRTPFVVKSILQLKNKKILIGSRNDAGIYEFKNKSFLPYLNQFPQLKTRINDMIEDKIGNIWIGTNEKGLYYYSLKNKLYEFNQKNGLNSNKINELDFDESGNLWVATNAGINKVILNHGIDKVKIFGFNKSHGLPSTEIEHIAVFNNKVWCGAKEHVFYFDCNKMTPNYFPPIAYMKSIIINDNIISQTSSPILKYNENNIEFNFDGITYKDPEQRGFLYKLNGYESEWKSSSTGQIQYTNLPNGTYDFQVYALNNDKVKSLVPASFRFTILKPFWFTWWCIIIEIIILILMGFYTIKWWINRIRKQEQEKTIINQKLAEFQMTAIRAQMNPHFIFNAISSIQHYILKSDVYQSYNYLAKFSKLIRNVLDNSKEEYISIVDEIHSLNLYLELEKVRFREPFVSVISVDSDLDQESTLIPTMLIQPYVENAIWHGLMAKKNDCNLSISFLKIEDNLQITIIDNGVGMEKSQKDKREGHISKGMSLTTLRIQSLSEKHGKPFSINITNLDNYDVVMSTGTKVVITMPLIID